MANDPITFILFLSLLLTVIILHLSLVLVILFRSFVLYGYVWLCRTIIIWLCMAM